MARHKNITWNLPESTPLDVVQAAVLMDIRDYLASILSEAAQINRRLNTLENNILLSVGEVAKTRRWAQRRWPLKKTKRTAKK